MTGRIIMTVYMMAAAVMAMAAPAPAQEPCSSPQARQFDFWVGEWTVTAGDKLAGHNVITTILGGCVLLEEYANASGTYSGKSFNYYDEADGMWHQVWVDNGGLRLHLAGGYADGRMTMSGERVDGDNTLIDRITWHDNDDGTVRQVWDQSVDGGATWNNLFDGLYTKK